MGGPAPAKRRAHEERGDHRGSSRYQGSSSGETSSSGKASSSARSRDAHSTTSSRVSRRGGFDGNRDEPDARNPAKSKTVVDPKNLDLSGMGWSAARGYDAMQMPPRQPPVQLGQPTKVFLNMFPVESWPKDKVYQHDVIIGSGTEKRGLIRAVWESPTVQKALGKGFIFDGNRIAWSMKPIERDIQLLIDVDKEYGRTPPKSGKENKHRIAIRTTNPVGFDVMVAYMKQKTSFDNTVLECVNFLDHLLRHNPSIRLTPIKRSFFGKQQRREPLGSAVEHIKGAYQSLRIVNAGLGKEARLAVNVDSANGAFWVPGKLENVAVNLTGRRDVNDLISQLRQGGETSRAGTILKKLKKLHVFAKHRGEEEKEWVIERLVWRTAKDYKFEKDGKMISIYDYFAQRYNIRLAYPDLPLCKMTKGKNTYLPMEVLRVGDLQRYNFKLDERQTSTMIKFCATPPQDRLRSIDDALKMLDWQSDPTLREYGMKISTSKVSVDARILPAPVVKFGAGEAKPGTTGRWDLKGKKFLAPNTAPLKSWGVCVIQGNRGGKPDRSVVQHFITEFIKIYAQHGGNVENRQPAMALGSGSDVGAWVTSVWNAAGNQAQSRPQILVFILPDKDSTTYGRIKRSAECRYGVVSQCMQYAHVQKCQPQYISNVCMKFNAKLGGTTARALGPKTGQAGPFGNTSTVVVGADVTHASPGVQAPSIAAITMSMDKLGIRYAADCQTNGFRVEMITGANINSMMKPMLQTWIQTNNGGRWPQRIFYLRDGVSEGQYQHVVQQEVSDMKKMIKSADPSLDIPFVVIVGSKRHHVRIFPEAGKGDRNGNPLPGTLVETGATNPFEVDFFLNSHAAIKGTARPMHYTVLMNEAKVPVDELVTMLYEHSYQYIRATTPVSQHPAMYYAHLAAARAIPHDPKWSGSSDATPPAPTRPRSGSQGSQGGGSRERSGSQGQRSPTGSSSGQTPQEFDKLMPMPPQGGIPASMWFI